MMPKVAVIPTGGTIDHVGRDRLDLAFYTETPDHLGASGLLARVPELARIADVELVAVPRLAGPAIGARDWLALRAAIAELRDRGDLAGVVITRGTNTLEETAYFLDLALEPGAPVVLTAAMRPPSAMSADGDLNLVNAVRVAAAAEARGLGALVVMNDRIHAARDVTKSATYRVDAFTSREIGPLGIVDADRISVARLPIPGRPRFDVARLSDLPRVDVILSYVGADGTFVDAAVAADARGIVSAGLGSGRATAAEDAAYDRAVAAGLVVVQASRVGAGRVIRAPALRRRRIVAAGDLLPWKARILLALALTRSNDPERVQDIFDRA